MAQIICISRNRPRTPLQSIGGVKFFFSPLGLISEDIPDEKAQEFLETPAYFTMHAGEPIHMPKALQKPADKDGGGSGSGNSETDNRTADSRGKQPPLNPNF